MLASLPISTFVELFRWVVPSADAVRECAATIGPDRRFYSTSDTVADIDMLRAALGVRTMVVDGVSYGTYVAERYALAHRGNWSAQGHWVWWWKNHLDRKWVRSLTA